MKRRVSISARGKSQRGGLNAKGRREANRQGSHLRPPVTKVRTKKDAKRRASFCARMSGNPGPMRKNGKPTRKALALRRWKCRKGARK